MDWEDGEGRIAFKPVNRLTPETLLLPLRQVRYGRVKAARKGPAFMIKWITDSPFPSSFFKGGLSSP
jgi:hypothetical protein